MNEELKPCPFCGGFIEHQCEGSSGLYVCEQCGLRAKFSDDFIAYKHGSKIRSEEKWNNRYEPTCKMEYVGSHGEHGIYRCSNCGAKDYESGNYCRNCRAKVEA